MDIRKVAGDDGITIFLEGKFTFSDRDKFHDVAFLYPQENVTNIVVDFEKLEYMDSTGVGMLLIMHENALKRGIHIKALNVGGHIRPLFEQSALGKLFEVYYTETKEH